MSAEVNLKGLRDGVLITLERGEFAAQLTELADLIDSRKTFFQGGQVAVQVGDRNMGRDELVGLCRVFGHRGVALSALLSTDTRTRSTADDLGLRTKLVPSQDTYQEAPPMDTVDPAAILDLPEPDPSKEQQGVLVKRTVRSGQSIHSMGHVVVLGDVNPGAEVIAGGDVIVWGHLRGMVHAGAMGDTARSVCALDLSPTQLRIGSHIAHPPEDKRQRKETRPERAFVSDNQIIAKRWQ
jgi:septum site-determining protein MinC